MTADQFAVEHWGSKFRWSAARLAFQLFPALSSSALEMAARGLRSTEIPRLFSEDLRPIHPSLNDDLLDLFGRCERMLRNQFTFLAQSESFSAEIDWERHTSEAWRTELHAFDYALELALNFRISGVGRYARHLRYLIAQWIAANPPGRGTGWLTEPLARRVSNWVLAADLARQDWDLDPTFCELVTESLALQVTFLRQYSSAICDSVDALHAARELCLAGRFFAGRKGKELSDASRALITTELDRRFTPEGRYTESRPGAQVQFARTIAEILAFGTLEASGKNLLEEKLYEALKVIEGTLLPDGTLPQFGAAPLPSSEDLSDLFALGAVILNEPMWKDIAGKFGLFPYLVLGETGKTHFDQLPEFPWEPTRCLQPHCGLFRLSVSADSAMIINGRIPSKPGDHQDGLSYELALRGQRAVVDSGSFGRTDDSSAAYFSTAAAHNVFLVDGEGPRQLNSGASLPPAEVVWDQEERTIGLRVEHSGFRSAGLLHGRAWFCLDGQAWVVLDALQGAGSRALTSLVHFYPTFEVEFKNGAATVRSLSLAFTIFPLGAAGLELTTARGGGPGLQGWHSPVAGMKYPASVLSLDWKNQGMPWVGGYLIVPGTEARFHQEESNAVTGSVNFLLNDRPYSLRVRKTTPALENSQDH